MKLRFHFYLLSVDLLDEDQLSTYTALVFSTLIKKRFNQAHSFILYAVKDDPTPDSRKAIQGNVYLSNLIDCSAVRLHSLDRINRLPVKGQELRLQGHYCWTDARTENKGSKCDSNFRRADQYKVFSVHSSSIIHCCQMWDGVQEKAL